MELARFQALITRYAMLMVLISFSLNNKERHKARVSLHKYQYESD